MRTVRQMIDRVAPTDATVLVLGESGVGKALVAKALHECSLRQHGPFVKVNCAALPLELLESELFGYERGAFTGAYRQHPGRFELANSGTIFLDEIGEISPEVQVKLLRVLQERTFRRVGGTEETPADIRIIAATNRDLSKMVAAGDFREDLYYRINVIPVRLPALREREQDIPLLADHFVGKFAEQMKKEITGISGGALACLRSYPWPGNVRELENAIERAVALERTPAILPESLPEAVREAGNGAGLSGAAGNGAADDLLEAGFDLEQHVQGIEKEYIAEALKRAGGVKKNAAELLGLSFRQFRYLLKKYEVQ
jgi:two-component system response regulator PilR (NtrC family)